jgi:hypothetical protein
MVVYSHQVDLLTRVDPRDRVDLKMSAMIDKKSIKNLPVCPCGPLKPGRP